MRAHPHVELLLRYDRVACKDEEPDLSIELS